MERNYLTSKETEALELFKKYGSQKDVANHMKSSGANISLTLKRAREKISRAKNTVEQAEEKGYLVVLGISHLTDTGRLLDALMNSSEKPICIMDQTYRILMVNNAIESLFGNGAPDIVGKTCHEVFMGKRYPQSDCPLSLSLKTGKMNSAIRKCVTKEGKEVTVKVTAIPVKNRRGRVAFGIEHFEPLKE